MRAICCAILALVFYAMGAVMANGQKGDTAIPGIHIFLSYVSIVAAIGLCIAGL